ncbi:MAG: hypothetical protein HC849_01695 [Oscillatoriales cyanobacterium RU_3_3]|nr:hypothetical protein [Oscillatoriales cyanobacterium RU_3_3]
MSQAILNQIFDRLEMLDCLELQQLDRAIQKYLAQKQQINQQEKIYKNANKQQLFRQWDAISDEEAAALKAEFTAEDLAFAETALTDCLPQLQQQDKI